FSGARAYSLVEQEVSCLREGLMLCNSCQRNIADGSRFCYNCGARQVVTEAPNVAAVTGGPKRLMRSSSDKQLGGGRWGLAGYLDMDPTLVRVLWVIVSFCAAGSGLLVYLVLWLVLPLAPLPVYTATAPQAPIVPQPGN